MGVKIYPYRVKEKAKSMNMKLETLKEGIAVEKEAQSWLSQKFLTLTGSAWDSARSYVSEVQLPLLATTVSWIEAEMAGNTAYQAAAERLPQVDCEHKGVKAAGFTDEEIRELSELGFTVEEATTAWQEIQERDITRADMARMDLGLVDVMVVWKNTGNEDGKILVTGLLKKQYEVEWGEIHSARDKRRCQSSWHGLIIRITVESWQDS